MNVSEKTARIDDNGGTQSWADRRQYPSMGYTPERRSGYDRRSGTDRRSVQIIRGSKAIERREIFRTTINEYVQ
jgi:hypothetical protein